MKNILITGISSGIGEALARYYLKCGDKVYGLSRRNSDFLKDKDNYFFQSCDVSYYDSIAPSLAQLTNYTKEFDLVILNAGILGEIKPITQTSLDEIEKVMNVNVWSNKIILDILAASYSVKQIVAISSGASVNGSFGWGGYSLSKATLNMLVKLYSREMKNTHISALAPGIIKTPMVDYILEDVDEGVYDSVKRIKECTKFTPNEIAPILDEAFFKLLTRQSGTYTDVRSME